jgi:uncharacterized protein YbbC (DUF1343 family)
MPFHSRDPYLTGKSCNGIFVNITNRDVLEPYKMGVAMVWAIKKTHPIQLEWNEKTMNRLVATKRLENMINDDVNPSEIFASWNEELATFEKIRQPYLIY